MLLAFAALIEVALWSVQPTHEFSATFAALIFIAYSFHRHFLFGEPLTFSGKPSATAPPSKVGWFFLTSAVLIVSPVAVGFALAFGSLDRPATGVVVLIFLPVYLATLGVFGTALPASVARDNTYRVSQGLRATFPTMWRLVLGPGVVGFVILSGTIAAGHALDSTQVTEGSLLTLAYYLVIRTLGFLTTILAVAVLCEMFRKTRPDPRAGPGTGAGGQTPA